MILNRKFRNHSLRARYISLAILLGIFMVAGAVMGYHITATESDEVNQGLNQITQYLSKIEAIKKNLQRVNNSLNTFIIEPHSDSHKTLIIDNINLAEQYTSTLKNSPLSSEIGISDNLTSLGSNLKKYLIKIKQLFDVRSNPLRQYPSLKVSRDVIQPSYNKINNAIDKAISESSAGAQPDLIELKNIWDEMNLYFRLYLSNKTGGINGNVFNGHADTVEEFHADL
ncbi:MAG: hypothetical protein OEL79_09925, partial [Chromatiales bacterium]|nr:hypothetical protein [Chromatiales bacterium]